MGVQDVVARLNKTDSVSKKQFNTPIPSKRIIPSANDRHLPPSPIPSPVSTINNKSNNGKPLFDDDSDNTSVNGITSLLQKFEQPPAKIPTPPESPIITMKEQQKAQKKITVTQLSKQHSLLDKTLDEIEALFQTLVDQNTAAEQCIQSLQEKVEKYASDATKVRDYEIRVEYLVTKLEQVTEERDFFEDQLNQMSLKNIDSSSSPIESLQKIDKENLQSEVGKQEDDADPMNELLDVYEEISTPEEDTNYDIYEQYTQDQSHHEEVEQQSIEADKGVQMTLMKYVTDLEMQKLETKALKEVVRKQDELITKLEDKIKVATENSEELLKEQVEVQRIELENKRELLAQLLNEREDLLKRLSRSRNSFRKSSLESLSSMSNRNSLRPSSFSSIGSISGRGTPPLTAPPKQPLPPLPKSSQPA